MSTKKLKVYSEVGKLRRVLVHKPGDEIENITPELMQRLLFDDIPYLKVAREEHEAFCDIMRNNGCEPVELVDTLAEVLKDEEIRKEFIDEFIVEARIRGEGTKRSVKSYLNNYTDLKALVRKMISGIYMSEIKEPETLSLADVVKTTYPFVLDPMPNLYFTRDPASIIGRGYSINKMQTYTRSRETIFMKYIFKYHGDFKGNEAHQFYDREEALPIEGGDILVLSDKVIAIGISERTDVLAIEQIAKRLLKDDQSFRTVLAFNIPNRRAFMHLDTVFTMVDRDCFTIHPEIEPILGIYSISGVNGSFKFQEEKMGAADVLAKYLEQDRVRLIRCGDGHPVTAAREQWNDGSNTLAIAPGEVIVYSRNHVTNDKLREEGIKLHVMPSSELSRGRGGPRCMSMPLHRDDL